MASNHNRSVSFNFKWVRIKIRQDNKIRKIYETFLTNNELKIVFPKNVGIEENASEYAFVFVMI